MLEENSWLKYTHDPNKFFAEVHKLIPAESIRISRYFLMSAEGQEKGKPVR
jgi:hypothetical protein